MSAVDTLFTALANRAELEARERGLRVIVKTSVTPAVVAYDARDVAPGILERLGIKTHIVAVTADGTVVTELGEPAATDPLLAAAVWATAAILGFVVVAALARALRR